MRLRNAALELYAEPGFDRTTAADIAARAGVTERTYFRHFPDKREVLFDGEAELAAALVDAVANAPDLPPLPLLRHAVLSVVPRLESDRALKQRRYAIVTGTAELREREATKRERLTAAVTDALGHRGVPRPLASMAATCAVAVLTRVRHEWLTGEHPSYAALVTEAFADLGLLIASSAGAGADELPPG